MGKEAQHQSIPKKFNWENLSNFSLGEMDGENDKKFGLKTFVLTNISRKAVKNEKYNYIYRKFAEYGWDALPTTPFAGFSFNTELKFLIREYIEPYKYLSGRELEDLSHEEYSWIKAREGYPSHVPSNKIITNEDILKS